MEETSSAKPTEPLPLPGEFRAEVVKPPAPITQEQGVRHIAMVCHEANRAWCHTLGDLSQQPWLAAPEWQRKSAVAGVLAHHEALKGGGTTPLTPRQSHEAWLAVKGAEGWKYGSVKDPEKKQHPCFLPYDELPPQQKMKDYLFSAIVRAFWLCSSEGVVIKESLSDPTAAPPAEGTSIAPQPA